MITVIHHKLAYKYISLFANNENNEWKWVYLGKEILIKKRIAKNFGLGRRYSFADDMSQIASENKNSFLDSIYQLGLLQKSKIKWWSHSFASMNPYHSDIFLYYCYLKLIEKWSSTKTIDLLIIVDNIALWRTVKSSLGKKIHMQFSSIDIFISKIYDKYLLLKGMFRYLANWTGWWFLFLPYKIRYSRFFKTVQNRKYNIFIHSWAQDRCFVENTDKKEYEYNDTYLCSLLDIYKNNNYKAIRVFPVVIPRHLVSTLYKTKDEFIHLAVYLRLRDIFKVLFVYLYPFININGDLGASEILIKADKNVNSYWYYRNLLNYIIMKRFFEKQKTENNSSFIYTFENQPWEKMLLLASRDVNSKIKMIGYQHTSLPKYLLNYFPGHNALNDMPLPDSIIVNDETHIKIFQDEGYPTQVLNGGSLRFAPKNSQIQVSQKKEVQEKLTNVLVLLGPDREYVLELVEYIINIASKVDTNFMLKPHPVFPKNSIIKYLKDIPKNVFFVEGSMNDFFEKISSVIHSGTTAALECLLQGIPVFKYKTELIDLDPLASFDNCQKYLRWGDCPDISDLEKPNISVQSDYLKQVVNDKIWLSIVL